MLSAIIIAKNEENYILECLKSISWVDEIVVIIDSQSTDKTYEIVKKFKHPNLKAIIHPFERFGKQKKFALDNASSEWVLSIDADERISKNLREEIKATLKNPQHDGYLLPRKNIVFGKWTRHCGSYPDYNIRLLKRGKGRYLEKYLHEKIVLQNKPGKLKNPIIHYRVDDVGERMKKINLFSTYVIKDWQRQNYKSSLFKLIFYPPLRLVYHLIYKRGFLDGVPGLFVCYEKFIYEVLRHFKYWQFTRYKKRNQFKIDNV